MHADGHERQTGLLRALAGEESEGMESQIRLSGLPLLASLLAMEFRDRLQPGVVVNGLEHQFGPAVPNVSELVETRYGFLLAFFGSSPESINARFHANFGMVHDNPNFTFTPLRLPFGGKNESGWILERKGSDYIERDGAFLYSKELVSFDG